MAGLVSDSGRKLVERDSVFDPADFDGASRYLVIAGQLVHCGLFDRFTLAHDKMAGASEGLGGSGALVGDAIVDFDVHGCSLSRVIFIPAGQV